MEKRRLGGSGLTVSRLALGTMMWGREIDEHEARDQLTAFVEAGGTLVDAAANYADGAGEAVLGTLIGKAVSRSDVVLATKAGVVRRGGEAHVDVSRKSLLDQLDESLDRLDVDHVDLWQVHAWSDDVPLDETLSALDHAVTTGRTRYVGISNYGGWQTAWAAVTQLASPARASLVSTQVEYSLLQRSVEAEVVPAARQFGLGVLPWSPLGRGALTGKYRDGTPADSRAADPRLAAFLAPYLDARSRQIVEAVCTAAEGLDALPLEVALAWVRDRPGVTAPVIGARTTVQLADILASDDLELPPEIRTALDEVSAPVT